MREHVGDVWQMSNLDAICITTNGFVKNNGRAVMGAGIAKQVAQRHPEFPGALGSSIRFRGNNLYLFCFQSEPYFSFPVKHNWWDDADLDLIERSSTQLMNWLDDPQFPSAFTEVALPRPGCGNGNLTWEQVKPVIEPILDDRVIVVSYGE